MVSRFCLLLHENTNIFPALSLSWPLLSCLYPVYPPMDKPQYIGIMNSKIVYFSRILHSIPNPNLTNSTNLVDRWSRTMKSAILEKNWRRCSRWVIPNLSISIRLNVSNYERHLHVTIGCHFALSFDRAAIWARLTAQPLTYPFWFSDEYDQLKYQKVTWDTIARLYIQFFWKSSRIFLREWIWTYAQKLLKGNYIKITLRISLSYLVRKHRMGLVWTCE